ncbi:Phosphomannomutase [Halotydeus destructor]|nr:Phosphomannomutase [Halotydeus destructor]
MASGDKSNDTICLFDIDGTLTKSRQKIKPDMEEFLVRLSEKVTIGLVGGSDLNKIAEQMLPESGSADEACKNLIKKYRYVFAENGLIAFKDGSKLKTDTIVTFMGEEKLQRFINFCLRYLSELTLPCKRGNFIEFRSGMINICPIGRSCSQAERDSFSQYDAVHSVRKTFVQALEKEFGPDFGLAYAIGGQISIDAFPKGWDKTYCLPFVSDFKTIHFVGDRTAPGGNDHEIFADSRTIGHTVRDPEETKKVVTELFFK